MINFQFYPKTSQLPDCMLELIDIFKGNNPNISSDAVSLNSTQILSYLEKDLKTAGYLVDKKNLATPVLFGKNGEVVKNIEYDSINISSNTILAVEAGQAVLNNKFIKNFVEISMVNGIDYLAIAVSNLYKPASSKSGYKDFDYVTNFFDAMYYTNKIKSPLKGLLIIGY